MAKSSASFCFLILYYFREGATYRRCQSESLRRSARTSGRSGPEISGRADDTVMSEGSWWPQI